jgi:hypothetical protein
MAYGVVSWRSRTGGSRTSGSREWWRGFVAQPSVGARSAWITATGGTLFALGALGFVVNLWRTFDRPTRAACTREGPELPPIDRRVGAFRRGRQHPIFAESHPARTASHETPMPRIERCAPISPPPSREVQQSVIDGNWILWRRQPMASPIRFT